MSEIEKLVYDEEQESYLYLKKISITITFDATGGFHCRVAIAVKKFIIVITTSYIFAIITLVESV